MLLVDGDAVENPIGSAFIHYGFVQSLIKFREQRLIAGGLGSTYC